MDLDAGTDTGTWAGKAFSYTVSNIERVTDGAGDDTLRGSSTRHHPLEGGGGRDTFVFGVGHGFEFPRIRGFTDGEDRIDLNELGVSIYSDLLIGADTENGQEIVRIDLSSYGGGGIGIEEFDIDDLDASDFLLRLRRQHSSAPCPRRGRGTDKGRTIAPLTRDRRRLVS